MSALIELVLGLFALTVVASIFYPIVLVLFLVNRKFTALLLPKQPSEPHAGNGGEQPFSMKFQNGSR